MTTTAAVDPIAARQAEHRAAALARYRELLETVTDETADEMLAAMKVLDKSREQMEQDKQKRQRVREAELQLLTAEHREEVQRRSDESRAEWLTEARKLIKLQVDRTEAPADLWWIAAAGAMAPVRTEVHAALAKADLALQDAQNRLKTDDQLRQRIAETRRQFPDAFN